MIPLPILRRYNVHAGTFSGKSLGFVEQVSTLRDAAEMAAIMLDRAYARQVAALLGEERGVFIAHGRVPYIVYPRGELVKEIRFALVLEVP